MQSRSLVLLRTPRRSDPYRQIFEEAGFKVFTVPVLQFQFIHQELLRVRLGQVDQYDGLIATSPRAVEALRKLDLSLDRWSEKPFFVVGPETARRAADLNLSPQGQEAGTADELAEIILDSDVRQPLLFLSGNRRRETLPKALRAGNRSFEELVVYETHLRERLDWPDETAIDWIAFFSPSGVEAAQSDGSVPWDDVHKAAIGSTTASVLRSGGWKVDAVAESPTPEGLYEAVVRAEEAQ